MSKTEIRLSGTGGQGIIKIAVILADAGLQDGYHVIQSQAYGPESRGGASKGEVVISEGSIYYPKVEVPDIVLCLSQKACDKYAYDIKDGGVLIIDSDFCTVDSTRLNNVNLHELPIITTAKDTVGSLCVNTMALGAVVAATGIVSDEAIETALNNNFKKKIVPVNLEAYSIGKKLVQA